VTESLAFADDDADGDLLLKSQVGSTHLPQDEVPSPERFPGLQGRAVDSSFTE